MKLKILFLSLVLSVSTIYINTFALSWVKFGDNWRYERGGTYITDRWREIDGKLYFFDYDSNMVSGIIVINGKLHAFTENGDAITTGVVLNGIYYQTTVKGEVLGLPAGFDLSPYKVAKTADVVSIQALPVINESNTTYFEDNNIVPTAPSPNN